MYDNGSRKECKTKSVLNHEGMNARQANDHQLFTRAQKFFIKKRKYFSRSKNKLIIIFNALFLQ